jgi:hypothetical protein
LDNKSVLPTVTHATDVNSKVDSGAKVLQFQLVLATEMLQFQQLHALLPTGTLAQLVAQESHNAHNFQLEKKLSKELLDTPTLLEPEHSALLEFQACQTTPLTLLPVLVQLHPYSLQELTTLNLMVSQTLQLLPTPAHSLNTIKPTTS